MISRARQVVGAFGWQQWLLATVFLVAIVLAGAFGFRTIRNTVYWTLHRDEPIQRWMPVNYVAHSYDVPPDILWKALELPDPRVEHRRDLRPLSEIASARGQSFEQVRTTLEAAIASFRESPPPPPAPPGKDGPAP